VFVRMRLSVLNQKYKQNDEPWPLMEETPGTIVIEEGKFLSCEECKENYWDTWN
jgi:hypothetical protein